MKGMRFGNRENPEPWNKVKPGTNLKYGSVNQKFERRYSRE